ncbi:MAG TPA: thioester domain-containing protein [Herpetosiphonaceae bacterium]|nr:thioester domain-containing protein [Herpetosiphonaceae bacterium]
MRDLGRMMAVALLTVFVGAGVASAQAETAATKTFTLQPGGKATVSYEAFCLDFGKKFPGSVNAPNGVADAKIQNALYYALTKGYQSSESLDLQYAIWELTEAQDVPQSGPVAAEIKAATAAAPALAGTSVLDAVRDNKVKLTMNSWETIGDKVDFGVTTDNFYGKGQLTLENTSQEALTLAMPVGTIFETPDAESQNMVGYATEVQVNNPVATMPETGLFDDRPNLVLTLAAGYFLLAAIAIKRFMRAYK